MTNKHADTEILAKALYLEDLAWQKHISWLNRYKLFQRGRVLELPLEEFWRQLGDLMGFELSPKSASWQSFLNRAETYVRDGLRLCYPGHEAWPSYLNSIADPPLWLWYKGAAPSMLNGRSTAAIVGARKVLPYSAYLTENIVERLVDRGHPIISGLAVGVDGLAHKACLKHQGLTAALLPCGLDSCYPACHQELLQEICQQGGFVASEFPPAYPIRRENFHYRNRLISGLGLAVFIIQAGERSGSLITGRLAAEQGRDVYVAPASLEFEAYRGSLRLIADGARIIDSYDIFDELLPENSSRLSAYSKAQDMRLAKEWQTDSGCPDSQDQQGPSIQAGQAPDHICLLGPEDKEIIQAIHAGLNSLEKLAKQSRQEENSLVRRVARLESQGYLKRSRGNLLLTETAVSCIYYKV